MSPSANLFTCVWPFTGYQALKSYALSWIYEMIDSMKKAGKLG